MEPIVQYILVALLTATLLYIGVRLWPKAEKEIDRGLDAAGLTAFAAELARISEYDKQIMTLQTSRAAAVTAFKAAQAAVAGLTVT
jgi:hypothetical protein